MILGIDFGEANLGLAISEGELAEPFTTLRNKNKELGFKEIGQICDKQGVTLIIVGVSEGKSAQRAQNFGNELSDVLRLPVKFVDETLSTFEAGEGKGDHKRAAAVILQRYLDNRADYA